MKIKQCFPLCLVAVIGCAHSEPNMRKVEFLDSYVTYYDKSRRMKLPAGYSSYTPDEACAMIIRSKYNSDWTVLYDDNCDNHVDFMSENKNGKTKNIRRNDSNSEYFYGLDNSLLAIRILMWAAE